MVLANQVQGSISFCVLARWRHSRSCEVEAHNFLKSIPPLSGSFCGGLHSVPLPIRTWQIESSQMGILSSTICLVIKSSFKSKKIRNFFYQLLSILSLIFFLAKDRSCHYIVKISQFFKYIKIEDFFNNFLLALCEGFNDPTSLYATKYLDRHMSLNYIYITPINLFYS